MAAKTPPDKYLPNWASNISARAQPGLAKEAAGFIEGESPGAENLNHMWSMTGAWNEVAGRTLAAKMAMRNVEYTTVTSGPTAAAADAVHIDYFADAGSWYVSSIDTAGNIYVNSSLDGVTWTSSKFIVNVGAGSTGDFTKFATDGTFCAIAADVGGTQAYAHFSTDLTATNVPTTGTNISTMDEASDLTYDAFNGQWICAGKESSVGKLYTSADRTVWSPRTLPGITDTDLFNLATNDAGLSVCAGNSQSYYSSTGTTWTRSATDMPTANNAAWAPSLGLFVCIENSTGDLWTSETGDVWRDQNAINSVPKMHNLVHGPDFFLGWGVKTTSTNGIDRSDLYAFSTTATDADGYNYQKIGTAWGDTIPYVSALNGVFRGGQGKIIYPYTYTPGFPGYRHAIARYGAE